MILFKNIIRLGRQLFHLLRIIKKKHFEYFINHFILRAFCAISRYQISNKRVNICSEMRRFVRCTCQALDLCQLLSNHVQLRRLTKYQQLSYNTNDVREKAGKFCALEYFDSGIF